MTLVLLLLALVGCARTVVLYPIEKSDIYRMKKGQTYTNTEKDGFFVSDLYLEEVMNVKEIK